MPGVRHLDAGKKCAYCDGQWNGETMEKPRAVGRYVQRDAR
jgi:hypothetical protein